MSATVSVPVRSPQWVLIYQGINITADISPAILSVSYTDQLSELSGEVEVVIEDHDQKWQSSWYPSLGDQVNLAIGYRGEGLLSCGEFEVDQLELSGPPDTFTMRCLATFITPAMRTRTSFGYENQTLLGIAATIAEKYGLGVVSAPEVIDVAFDRVTQKYQTDLAFLKRLAIEHDYDFTVRGSTLVFYSRTTLEAVPPRNTLARTDLVSFQFRNRTSRIYRGSETTYHDPMTKSLISQSVAATITSPTSDLLKCVSRCENGQQALLKAQAALHSDNSFFFDGDLVMPGSTAMASGNTIGVSGFGEFDGTYIIVTARHQLDRASGYTTRLEVSRVF
jgi:hypothetical protein